MHHHVLVIICIFSSDQRPMLQLGAKQRLTAEGCHLPSMSPNDTTPPFFVPH